MFRILSAGFIAPDVKRFQIEAPRIARKHLAGQFLILRLNERGERVPLTIESANRTRGVVAIVVQSIGRTTYQLNAMEAGEAILDVVGPLGKLSVIKNFGTVVIVGGGVGTALAYPTTVALKRAGNRIVTILGGRNRDLVILENEMKAQSDELFDEEGYDGVFIATGAGLPVFLNVPGEHLNGVYSANEFLTRMNLMHAYEFPRYDEPMVDLHGKHVAVIGGGNTALDAIRSARRLGAEKAYVNYRRSAAEMPARAEEVKHAMQEGIDFQVLTNPVEFLDDGRGWLRAARCVRMELGEPDRSGRWRPIALEGSEFEIPLHGAIIATGT
jgi:ferredoxin-NADP reductase